MSNLQKFLKDLSKTYDVHVSEFKDVPVQQVPTIPSGSFNFDRALGVNGIPRGRILEIFGAEASGKTLLSLIAMGEAQKLGHKVAFIDMEQTFDPSWAKKLGVNVDEIVFVQPEYGEQALNILERLVESKEFALIVLDSVASLVPKAIMEAENEQQHIGVHARMLNKSLQKLVPMANKSQTAVIFINQVRVDVGRYGNPETTTGGKALKFYSSIRVRMSKESGSDQKESGIVVGHTVKMKVVKNKVAPPFQEATFDIDYRKGVDKAGELLDISVAKGIIERPNNVTYKFEDQSFRGRPATLDAIREDKKFFNKLSKLISESEEKTDAKEEK